MLQILTTLSRNTASALMAMEQISKKVACNLWLKYETHSSILRHQSMKAAFLLLLKWLRRIVRPVDLIARTSGVVYF